MGAVCACLNKAVTSLRCDRQTCMVYSRLKVWEGCAGCCTKTLVCLANAFGTPWCLAWHLTWIYVVPCVYYTFESCYYAMWRKVCGEHFQYEDKAFPANEKSLGKIGANERLQIEWARLTPEEDLEKQHTISLFQDGIDPSDVCQGALGNCWLLSAAACLCEFEGAVEQLFIDKQANPRGKYRLWLYDVQSGKWRKISVDDRVPVDSVTQRPVFSQPHGDEVWVLLLEKAFAKFTGAYANIESGHTVWAFEAMTGDSVVSYQLGDHNLWEHLDMKPVKNSSNKRAVGLYRSKRFFDSDHMFKLLCSFDSHSAVLGAGSRGRDDTLENGRGDTDTGGIVPGHAYTIKAAAEHHKIKLLKLRNPWGTFEWKGRWSDGSKEWTEHPQVAKAFGYSPNKSTDDDGIFFIEWCDFLKHFNHIDCCVRTQGMSEFVLRVHEEYGLCGPTVGCCLGVSKFLCLCRGLYKMWCGRQGNAAAIHDLERPFLHSSSS